MFFKDLEFQWVKTFSKIKLILMQEEESSVYPQLVELQQQLQQQLGRRVELSRCHLFCVFLLLFWGYFGRFYWCNVCSLLVQSISNLFASLLNIGSKHITKYFEQPALILVQSTWPNIFTSLLYHWFKAHDQIFFTSLLYYWFNAHHQIIWANCFMIGSKRITKYFEQSASIFVQSTLPNILNSLL